PVAQQHRPQQLVLLVRLGRRSRRVGRHADPPRDQGAAAQVRRATNCWPRGCFQCPLWVISGHFTCSLGMSAFRPKADLLTRASESPLSANNEHCRACKSWKARARNVEVDSLYEVELRRQCSHDCNEDGELKEALRK